MSLKATDSFIIETGGTRHEVHKGDLLSDSHPTAQAEPKKFAKASEKDITDAVEKARGPQS
jgi:hypothetical protein